MADDERGHGDATPDDAATDDAALAVAARHALHDEELVAALATDSLEDDADVLRAQGLVERCSACRELHRDLVAIGASIRMDAKGSIAAPRDFRLTVADAQRLGGRVVRGGFVATLRKSLVGFGRPIGASMAALGVVGLLVGSATLSGGAGSLPTVDGAGSVASFGPGEIQSGQDRTASPKSSDRNNAYAPGSSVGTGSGGTGGAGVPPGDSTNGQARRSESGATAWLIGGSAALLVGGVALVLVGSRRDRQGGFAAREP